MCLAGRCDGDGYVGAPLWDGQSHDRLASWRSSSARKFFFMMVYLDNDNEDGRDGCQESFVIVWCLLIKIDTISLPAYLVEVLSSQEVQKENSSSLTPPARSVPSSLGNPRQREWPT